MKILTTLLLLFSITCFAQENDKKGTITVKKENKQENSVIALAPSKELQSPTFKGGEQAFNRFLQSNLKYPITAKNAGISGICYVNFTVDTMGQISDIKLLKGIPNCPDCDKEALRVMSIMPIWNPATKNGKAFDAQVNMPINFRLK